MPATLMGRMPRPNDPEIIKRFAEATAKGHPVATAAQLAGISRVTAQEWIVQGNAQLEAGDELGSHASFAAEHNQALAALVDAKLDQIHDAAASGPKFWPAAMTLIERRFPRDFGRNERLEIEQRTVTLVTTYDQLPPAQREALIALLGGRTDDNSEPATLALPPPSDTNTAS